MRISDYIKEHLKKYIDVGYCNIHKEVVYPGLENYSIDEIVNHKALNINVLAMCCDFSPKQDIKWELMEILEKVWLDDTVWVYGKKKDTGNFIYNLNSLNEWISYSESIFDTDEFTLFFSNKKNIIPALVRNFNVIIAPHTSSQSRVVSERIQIRIEPKKLFKSCIGLHAWLFKNEDLEVARFTQNLHNNKSIFKIDNEFVHFDLDYVDMWNFMLDSYKHEEINFRFLINS
jgi:hypothetical protein